MYTLYTLYTAQHSTAHSAINIRSQPERQMRARMDFGRGMTANDRLRPTRRKTPRLNETGPSREPKPGRGEAPWAWAAACADDEGASCLGAVEGHAARFACRQQGRAKKPREDRNSVAAPRSADVPMTRRSNSKMKSLRCFFTPVEWIPSPNPPNRVQSMVSQGGKQMAAQWMLGRFCSLCHAFTDRILLSIHSPGSCLLALGRPFSLIKYLKSFSGFTFSRHANQRMFASDRLIR